MLDIWGFLLQTLMVSGVAVLLLVIKALFKDKLPPKWHFAVWGVLGFMILIPAGFNGRYTLFRWQLVVELIKVWFGDYSATRVLFPIPILTSIPKNNSAMDFRRIFFRRYYPHYKISYIIYPSSLGAAKRY